MWCGRNICQSEIASQIIRNGLFSAEKRLTFAVQMSKCRYRKVNRADIHQPFPKTIIPIQDTHSSMNKVVEFQSILGKIQ